MPPRVSILMPVRNEAEYLPAALASLYRQTMGDWELVAVDDGSCDATPRILSEAAGCDPRIRPVMRNREGLVAALNTALSHCTAPLVARMDGDDINHPRRLEMQLAYMETHPETGLLACGFRHFPRTGLKQGMIAYETWQNGLSTHDRIMADIFVESPFVHPSVMVRRTILENLGGYRNCGWPEDYDLWLRMAAAGIRFAKIPAPLLFWRDHPERATRTMDEYAASAFRACKAHHLAQGFLKAVSGVILAGAGLEGRAWMRALSEYDIAVNRWIDVDPRKVGRSLHGAPVEHIAAFVPDGTKILVSIGVHGAREQFRERAAYLGLREMIDYVCVA